MHTKKYRRQGKMFLRQLSQMLEFTIRISYCCSRSPHEAPSTLLLLTVYARKFLTYEAQSWFSLPYSRLRSSWYLTTHSDQTECSRRTQSSSLFTFVENVWHVSLQSLCILQFVNSAVFLFTYYHSTPCNLENSPVKKITINILRERRGKQCKITVDPLKIIFLIAQFKSNKWTRIYNWSLRRQM